MNLLHCTSSSLNLQLTCTPLAVKTSVKTEAPALHFQLLKHVHLCQTDVWGQDLLQTSSYVEMMKAASTEI